MEAEVASLTNKRQYELECAIHSLEHDMMFKQYKLPGSDFVSSIKFGGVPILPPVLTKMRREEMQKYRQLAVLRETEHRSLVRRKMLEKLETPLKDIDEFHRLTAVHVKCKEDCDDVIYGHVETRSPNQETSGVSENSPYRQLSLSDYDIKEQSLPKGTTDGSALFPVMCCRVNKSAKSSPRSCCCEPVQPNGHLDMVSAKGSPDSGIYSKSVSESLLTMCSSVMSYRETSSGYESEMNQHKTYSNGDSLGFSGDLVYSQCLSSATGMSVPSEQHMYDRSYDGTNHMSASSGVFHSGVVSSLGFVGSCESSLGDIRSSIMSNSSGEDEMNRTVIGADEIVRSNESSCTMTSSSATAAETVHAQSKSSVNLENQLESGFGDSQYAAEEQSRGNSIELGGSRTTLLDCAELLSVSEDDSFLQGSALQPSSSQDDANKFTHVAVNSGFCMIDEANTRITTAAEIDVVACDEHEANVEIGYCDHGSSSSIESSRDAGDSFATHTEQSDEIERESNVSAVECMSADADTWRLNNCQSDGDGSEGEHSSSLDHSLSEVQPIANRLVSSAKRTSRSSSRVSASDVSSDHMLDYLCQLATNGYSRSAEISAVSESTSSCSDTNFQSDSQVEIVIDDANRSQCERHEHLEQNNSSAPLPADQDYCLTSSMEDLKLRRSAKKPVSSINSQPDHCIPLNLEMPKLPVNLIIDPPAEFQDHSLEDEEYEVVDEKHIDPCNLPSCDLLEKHGKEDHIRRYLNSLDNQSALEEWSNTDMELPVKKSEGYRSPYLDGFCATGSAVNSHRRNMVHETQICRSATSISLAGCDTSAGESRMLTEDVLLELELEQYEQTKQQLLEEHQQKLQNLLAKQEQEMAELWNRLSSCGSVLHNSVAISSFSHIGVNEPTSAVVAQYEIPSTKGSVSSVGLVVSSIAERSDEERASRLAEKHLTSPPRNSYKSTNGFKAKSPAGVYYSDRLVTSPVPSSTTNVTEDTESEFAFNSPAVLRSNHQRSIPDRLPCVEKHSASVSNSLLVDSNIISQVSTPNTSRKSTLSHVTFASPSNAANSVHHNVHLRLQRRYISPFLENIPADVQRWCEKMSAVVKGYLTRRLYKSEKVQSLIRTVWDTAEFALQFDQESPNVKKGVYSVQDRFLRERILAQLESAVFDFHEIFFDIPVKDRMRIIAVDREARHERIRRDKSKESTERSRHISAATLKSIERKKKALEHSEEEPKNATKKSQKLLAPVKSTSKNESNSLGRRVIVSVVRPARVQLSPRKQTKHALHRFVIRDKSRASCNLVRVSRILSPVKSRAASQQQKPAKHVSAASLAAMSESEVTTRKVARPGGVVTVNNCRGDSKIKSDVVQDAGSGKLSIIKANSKTSSPGSVASQPSCVIPRHCASTRLALKNTISASSKNG